LSAANLLHFADGQRPAVFSTKKFEETSGIGVRRNAQSRCCRRELLFTDLKEVHSMASRISYLLTVSALALAPVAAFAADNSATQSIQNFDSVFQSIEQQGSTNGQSSAATGTTLPALSLIAPPPTLNATDYQTLLGSAQTAGSTFLSQAQSMAASYVGLLETQTLASMFESLTLGLLDAPSASLPSNSGGGGGGGNPPTATTLPCDAASAAGTPCSAAHSVTRLLTAKYAGPLFQVQRVSDKTTQNVYPYTTSTLPAGASASLVGSANVASITAFCANTSCTVSYLYDQIDLVGPLKGTFGNVAGSITLNTGGSTTSLTVPAGGGAGSQTVAITNGFASLVLPNSGGTLSVQLTSAAKPTAATPVSVSIGNDLPAVSGKQASVSFTSLGTGVQIPALATLGGQAYRNRVGTVNQSIGDADIAEYMVVGAQYGIPSNCCGTYGNMETVINPPSEVEGIMFAMAYASGNAAVFGYSAGYTPTGSLDKDNTSGINWPGVDAEAGVYLYGPQQPSTEQFVTTLAKYSPASASNLFAVKGGDASQGVLTAVYDQAPPPALDFFSPAGTFHGAWEGGLSLGEGGDASGAPIQFYEGAIIAKATSDATDNAIQTSIGSFYGPPAAPTAAACYANNLVNLPLSLPTSTAWTQQQGVTVAAATDISGTSQNAVTITQTSGSAIANVDEWIKIQAGQTYTFTDYVLATTNATVFPAGSIQTDDSSAAEFAWVLDTNKGQAVAGTWGNGKATSLSAVKSGSWWKVTMTFTAPSGSNNAHIFIDPPNSSAAGVRSQQAAGLNATHFCPGLAITSTLTTATATQ
jgi:non-reducing end alpha-L-arabinofuranosidase